MEYRAKDAAWLEALRCRKGDFRPAVFVETGTYRGVTTRLALQQFSEVHTIERSPELFAEISTALEEEGAHCWCGDSAAIVPLMVPRFEQPVFWFLDAHWVPDIEMLGPDANPLPLLDELRAIATRHYHDVVVVDDVSCFGKGPQTEWEQVTVETIAALFPDASEVVVLEDQLAVYR